MVTRTSQLLALIHQHLLQNGYGRTARELQIESGEQFISQTASLKQIFRHWNTKDQKRKGSNESDAPSKKPRLQDPVSSSESSDEEDNAHPKGADLVVQGKKDSIKKAGKLKTKSSTPKKMNSAKKSASKGKGTTKTGAASLNLKPVAHETPVTLAKSSEDSDSEDETVPSKATPVLERPLKSTPAEVVKSKTSLSTDSRAAWHDKSVPAKTTTTKPLKPLSSSNGKAMAKEDSSETSESSDETDIEKPPVTVTPNITTQSVSKLKTKTPSTGTQPKEDSSESSESESEEEPGSQVKAITPSPKTSAAKLKATKKNAITKAAPVAPASQSGSAVGKPPAKTMVDETSEDSDSDEELVPLTPIPTAPSSVQASKQKLQMQPTVPKPSSDESSTSSETESEEEPVRQKMPLAEVAASQDKVDPPVTVSQSKPAKSDCNDASADTVVAVVSEKSASLGKTQSPAKAEVSETSDSSDSEKEPENQKTTASPKKSVTPATQAKVSSAHASKPSTVVPAAAEGSESSDSSDSESEAPKNQKTTASPKKSVTPATQAKVSSAQASKQSTVVPAAAEGSESSDSSDSESEAPKKAANNFPKVIVRTPVPSTKRPVATSHLAKARTPLPAPADDTSETEDSDHEEKPAAKKTASQLSASSLKTPSTSAKQPVTPSHPANAVAGKSRYLQKTTVADDSSETEDSDSEEDEGAKKTGSKLPASSVKTPPTGRKQPVTLAAHTTPLPADDSSETEDSDSDESLPKAPPGIVTPKQKPIAKSTAVTPASQASVAAVRTPAKTAADESSEDSDSDEEPSSSIKAPVPTISPSVRPSESITARVPDSDADSESSDSEEKTPTVGTTKPSKPALAAKGKPGISATLQPDEESSSDDSDSDSDTNEHVQSAIQTPKTKVASHNKTAATPSPAPLSATKEKTPGSRKARVAQNPSTDTSETIDSSDYDNPLPAQTLKGSFVPQKRTVKRSLQPGTAVKSKKGSPVKAVTDTMKESSGSIKEDQKTDVRALPKHKMSTAISLLTSTPSGDSPSKGKAGLPMKSQKAVMTAQALVKESSESESHGKVTEQVGTPAPKRNRSVAKTPKASKEKTVKPASRGKTSVALPAKVSSESSESSSSGEKAAKATKQTPTVQTKLEKFFTKHSITPAKTKAKTTASLLKAFLTDSDETSDDEEKPVEEATPAPDAPKTSRGKHKERLDSSSLATSRTKAKMACLLSSPKATNNDSKVSGDVPSKPTASGEEDDSADNSEPEESQSLLQAKTPSKPLSTKRKQDKEDKTALADESIAHSSKKKHRVKTQPSTKSSLASPATPGALLDSEEETVMALLEGRSPKKSRKNPSKKTVAATLVVASSTPTVQDSNVLEKSLPPPVPESPSSVHKGDKTLDAKSPGVTELSHLSAKKEKRSKKRKSSPEDGLSKQKHKKAKKEKKDKKVKDTSITGEAARPKPSKKEKKSEKSKKKNDKKQKKNESEKLSQSLIAPVGESTDSGVSLQSKPKKKKKVKGD
ncbi:treacle protein isoform X2 [Bufo bufo]|uniref:treacle protein isoform X2 n=1 Tax=Bufo bufo TaxID=8384 RepID=UPI001ABEC23D|nr:treacle protein isoform X2 [Bufo bufo]